MGMRNIYISLLVFIGIAFPGALLLRPLGGGAIQAIGVVALVTSYTVLRVLYGRGLYRMRGD